MRPQSKILIFKFPYKSFLSGIDKHTIKVVKQMQKKGMNFLLLSSCASLLSEFRKKGWLNQRWWAGLEPVTTNTKILFFFLWPFILISLFLALIYYRLIGYKKIYCLTLTEKFLLVPIARLLGYKIYWLELLSPKKTLWNNVWRFLYLWFYDPVTIITNSFYVKRELVKMGINEQNIKVIYEGVDSEMYHEQKDLFDFMAAKKYWPIDQIRYKLGFIGKLEQEKGLHILIKAVSLIKDQIPEIYLTIVGEGSKRDNLEWLIKHLKVSQQIKLVGFQEDILRWIWDFDVFVLPSSEESFGITAVEALVCKKPVIASQAGGLPEIIEQEKQGLLFEAENSQALADTILKMYKNKELAEQLAEAGQKKVKQKFTLQQMTEDFYKILSA